MHRIEDLPSLLNVATPLRGTNPIDETDNFVKQWCREFIVCTKQIITISNIISDCKFLEHTNALATWHIAVIIHVIILYPNVNAITAAGSKLIFPSFSLIASANLLKCFY